MKNRSIYSGYNTPEIEFSWKTTNLGHWRYRDIGLVVTYWHSLPLSVHVESGKECELNPLAPFIKLQDQSETPTSVLQGLLYFIINDYFHVCVLQDTIIFSEGFREKIWIFKIIFFLIQQLFLNLAWCLPPYKNWENLSWMKTCYKALTINEEWEKFSGRKIKTVHWT